MTVIQKEQEEELELISKVVDKLPNFDSSTIEAVNNYVGLVFDILAKIANEDSMKIYDLNSLLKDKDYLKIYKSFKTIKDGSDVGLILDAFHEFDDGDGTSFLNGLYKYFLKNKRDALRDYLELPFVMLLDQIENNNAINTENSTQEDIEQDEYFDISIDDIMVAVYFYTIDIKKISYNDFRLLLELDQAFGLYESINDSELTHFELEWVDKLECLLKELNYVIEWLEDQTSEYNQYMQFKDKELNKTIKKEFFHDYGFKDYTRKQAKKDYEEEKDRRKREYEQAKENINTNILKHFTVEQIIRLYNKYKKNINKEQLVSQELERINNND